MSAGEWSGDKGLAAIAHQRNILLDAQPLQVI